MDNITSIDTYRNRKNATTKTVTEVLDDAADILQQQGWTNHDYEYREHGDGEDIITAITKAAKTWVNPNWVTSWELQMKAITHCLTALDDRIHGDGYDEHQRNHYRVLLSLEYPGAALVYWQTMDCQDKWDAIELIEEAIELLAKDNN